jgi:DMSO/TMAO reductase YedYZ molybdopterin-dependent catalytic subunit
MTRVIHLFEEDKNPMKKKYLTQVPIATILALLLVTPIGAVIADNAPSLEITNLSGASYDFSYAQLLAMPKTNVSADLYCDGALVTYGNWGGVLLSYLLTQAQVTSEVCSIHFVASDGYTVAIPIDLAMQPQIIVAYERDSQPLAEGLRLIIPEANGGAWIAMITSITMSTSGTDYPPAISVGGGKENSPVSTQNSTPQPSPYQQEVPVKPKPSTPENSSIIQEATPTNVTYLNQSAINPQVSNQSLNLQTSIYLIVFTCAISFTTIAYGVYRHKRKKTIETS